MSVHIVNAVSTELNATTSIWCEFCGKNCSQEHLIRITSLWNQDAHDVCVPICTSCASDLIACLKKSLVDALLTNKELI